MTIGTIDREVIRMEKYIPTVTVPVTIELDDVMFEHLDEKEVLPRLISTPTNNWIIRPRQSGGAFLLRVLWPWLQPCRSDHVPRDGITKVKKGLLHSNSEGLNLPNPRWWTWQLQLPTISLVLENIHLIKMAENFLYSFNAKKVKAKLKGNGDFRLSFKVNNTSKVAAFSERPDREAYSSTINFFVKTFKSNFSSSKPNGSFNKWDDGGSLIANYKIKKMELDNKNSNVIMIVQPMQILPTEAISDKSTIEKASFFIDYGTTICDDVSCNTWLALYIDMNF